LKIAFDENFPPAMVRVFQALATERQFRRALGGFRLTSAPAYTPKRTDIDYRKKDDVPWVTRFAADDGRVIISGDVRMMDVPHELLALKQLGLVTIFFEAQWNGWKFFPKSSLVLHYWPKIIACAKSAKKGTFHRVPAHWKVEGDLYEITTPDDKITRKAPKAADLANRAVSASGEGTPVRRGRGDVRGQSEGSRRQKRKDDRQTAFPFATTTPDKSE
jgi:hypothetical protein